MKINKEVPGNSGQKNNRWIEGLFIRFGGKDWKKHGAWG